MAGGDAIHAQTAVTQDNPALFPQPTPSQLWELLRAIDQCLDDMGEHGRCVCGLAHAWLRLAYEPFRIAYPDEGGELLAEPPMTLASARAMIEGVS